MGSGHACFKPDDLDDLDDAEIIARIDRDALRWLDATNVAPVSFAAASPASGKPAARTEG